MRNNKLYILLSMTLTLALSACCKDEEELPESQERLYVSAILMPFAEDVTSQTRSADHGFLTSFEEGDVIGVTGIDADGNVIDVCNNVRFVYQESETVDDNIWSSFLNDRGYGFVEKVKGARYFAYYPYDSKWDGMNLDYIIANFTVEEDQHTKENFTKSDLIAPDEPILPDSENLRFVMNHKMATISIFYNNEWNTDGTPLYPIRLFPETTPTALTIDHTYRSQLPSNEYEHRRRYLVNPREHSTVKLTGRLEETSYRYFSHTLEIEPGHLYSISFEGEPSVPYTDGVDLELDSVPFIDKNGDSIILGHTVIWSKYNLGESAAERYPFAPDAKDKGGQNGGKNPEARGDYYAWAATFTQYDNGLTGYKGYGLNNYFDKEYMVAPLGGTIKETEYDVAHAKWWRGKWRLPTENEFRAMYAGCTFENVGNYTETNTRYIGDYNNRPKGTYRFNIIKVTSKRNPEKFIYFSTGGYLDGTVEPEKGEDGQITESGDGKKNAGLVASTTAFYLSSSASPTILRCISYAYFTDMQQNIKIDGSRYTGMLVRPVYSPNENKNQ
ncbi:MAG: fimbrillin family protein [Prevotella sp.]